ncbi:MAG: hypothetical protein VX583_13645 [Bdellovibrionota bacterium]|nr:hypothetical protein [Pseudobdellovibrionaceae bacterium]|tara:strand:+ start:4705 stop:5466 length:762 start_codon:yes stop_codon:yes gene_type:complete
MIDLILLSGFMGEESDYAKLSEFLPKDTYNIIYIDIRDEKYWKDRKPSFENFDLSGLYNKDRQQIFVGYSLGGRILAQYFLLQNTKAEKHSSQTELSISSDSQDQFQNTKVMLDEQHQLVLLASALGCDEDEIPARIELEDKIFNNIKKLNFESFAVYWESMPLFRHSVKRRFKSTWTSGELEIFFQNFRQSQQTHLKDFVKSPWVHLLVGELDKKYCGLYKNYDHQVLKGAGHRLPLDAPEEIAGYLLQIGN